MVRDREYDLWIDWVWNDNARDLARDYALLQNMCLQGTNYPVKKTALPLDTALRCLDLVRADLRKCREIVAKDCAPWFDNSAFAEPAQRGNDHGSR